MARNRKVTKASSSRGPQVVTALLGAGAIAFGVIKYQELTADLDQFHLAMFNTTEAKTTVKVDITSLGLVVRSRVTSVPNSDQVKLKQFPIFSTPLTYRITHRINFATHSGTLELKLSENSILAENIASDIATDFTVEDKNNILITNPTIVYKTLDREIKLSNMSGKLSLTNDSTLQLASIEYKDPKYAIKVQNMEFGFNKQKDKFQIKAANVVLNDIPVTALNLNVKGSDLPEINFKAMYQTFPIEGKLATKPMVSGHLKIPVTFIDAAFDPAINLTMKQQEQKIKELNNEKLNFKFAFAQRPQRIYAKKMILGTFANPKNIRKDQDFYHLTFEKTKNSINPEEVKSLTDEAVVGVAYEKFQTNPDEAIGQVKSLLSERPMSSQAYMALGWMYYQKSQFDLSLQNHSTACALGERQACLYAGDQFNFKRNDNANALLLYDIACDLKSGNGCLKAGLKAELLGQQEQATNFFARSCNEMKDTGGCYQVARTFQKLKKSKDEVASYLDLACKDIKSACTLAGNVKNGRSAVIPQNP